MPTSNETSPANEESTLTLEQRQALGSSSTVIFMRTLRALEMQVQRTPNPQALLEEALCIVAVAAVPESEQLRRASLLVKHSPPALFNDKPFLSRLAALPTFVRSGIANALPTTVRHLLYDPLGTITARAPRNMIEESRHLERLRVPTEEVEPDLTATVIILSPQNNPETEANLSLLHDAKFPVYRVTSDEELQTYLVEDDICAFVIDGSYWIGKNADEQEDQLCKIVRYSSFACLVVDATYFHTAGRLYGLIEKSNCSPPHHQRVLVRQGSRLSGSDLFCLRRSAGFLSLRQRPQLVSADIGETETVAVIAAAKAFFRDELGRSEEQLASLRIGLVGEGRSQAKLFRLYFNSLALPVIAKVGSSELIVDEVERYKAYIALRCDVDLKRFVYFHAGVGVTLFALVPDSENPFQPAPTLDERIAQLRKQENWNVLPETYERQATAIEQTIKRACCKLTALNKQPCPPRPNHMSYAYLRGSGMNGLIDRGLDWNLPDWDSNALREAVQNAHSIVEVNDTKAIVHGDVHLKNILTRDDGDASFIDYAYSGPGYPAFDLTRLECSLCYTYLRQCGSEDNFLDFQRAMTIELLSEEALRQRFPSWWSCRSDVALLRGMLSCRDQCIKVLRHHGLDREGYVAAKFLLSCFSMLLPELQMGLVRGTIRALAPQVHPSIGFDIAYPSKHTT